MSEYFGRRHRQSVRPLSPRRSAPLWFLLVPAIPVGLGLWASLPLQPVPDAPRLNLGAILSRTEPAPAAAPSPHEEMLRLGLAHQSVGPAAPLSSAWQPVSPPAAARQVEAAPPTEEARAAAASPAPEVRPFPAPRPPELAQQTPVPERPRVANASIQRRARMSVAAAPAAPAPDNRSFLERLFGNSSPRQPAGQALAYAPSQDDGADMARSRRLGRVTPSAGELTAVYDISAKAVYLPSGEKLEAHSGLGERLDDPRYVHVRMKGATPPHVYDLSLRESLFHGVRAIRLNPVGGSGAIHGRDGLLAHTYMLGPNGDSNGCVSIRNYDRFLQAYLKGEIRKLVVVASMN